MVVYDVAELQQSFEDECELNTNTQGIFVRERQYLMRRAARYVKAQGQHFA
jgi:hypothetical protein